MKNQQLPRRCVSRQLMPTPSDLNCLNLFILAQRRHHLIGEQINRFVVIRAEFGEGDVVVAQLPGGAYQFNDLIADFFRRAGGVISFHHMFGDQCRRGFNRGAGFESSL